MSILFKAKKQEALFRTIMEEYKKDVQFTKAEVVTELDWNSNNNVLFYSIMGKKAAVSRHFYNVDWFVYNKFIQEIEKK
ncbi:MAG: hypothetical protein IKF97_02885 [Clostridia bacterium]|nr:hypothetical protein [Clostridia bacterium]